MQDEPATAPPASENEPFRVLLVAADAHVADPVRQELSDHASNRATEVRVVVPALAETAFQHAAGAVDEGMERARRQLDQSLEEVKRAGLEGNGQVGDADPLLAIDDALYEFPADEIVIVTHPEADARWLEADLFERARHRFAPPLRHFVVDGGRARLAEQSDEGLDRADEAEVRPPTENLPRFSARDVAGIAVAIVGTMILIVIAASNPDETASGYDADALHTIIAGVFALINIAHVVGLVLFESVGYRGLAQRLFAGLSLYGTPAAIVVSLLLLLA